MDTQISHSCRVSPSFSAGLLQQWVDYEKWCDCQNPTGFGSDTHISACWAPCFPRQCGTDVRKSRNADRRKACKENSKVRVLAHSVGHIRGSWTQIWVTTGSAGITNCSISVLNLVILDISAYENVLCCCFFREFLDNISLLPENIYRDKRKHECIYHLNSKPSLPNMRLVL